MRRMPVPERKYQVLMVCTGNICRSPMASGLLAHRLPVGLQERVTVASAGIGALHGQRAAEQALAAMAEVGIDIGPHRARQLSAEMLRQADLVLAMQQAHLDAIRRMAPLFRAKPDARLLSAFGPATSPAEIADPYGEPLESYRLCRRTLRPCIDGLILWLKERLGPR